MTDRLRFSTLKAMALSPLHFKHASTHELEPSRAMRIGTATHARLLGGSCVVFDGTRRGKAWELFKAERPGVEIVTGDEADVAGEAARAVLNDPVAGPLFVGAGTNEKRLDWDFNGVPFRSTPDRYTAISRTLVELKTTRDAEPGRFIRDAQRRHYHAQVGVYREALKWHGFPVDRVVIVAVETSPPFAVSVIDVTESALDVGYRTASLWLERYRIHAAADVWPSYSQAPVPWEIVEETELDFGDGDEPAEEEAA